MNLVRRLFLPRLGHDHIKPAISSNVQTATKTDRIILVIVRIGDFRVCAWFRVVDNISIDVVLGPSFIDCCIADVFQTEQKVVPWQSLSALTLFCLRMESFLFSETYILKVKSAHASKWNGVYHSKGEEEFHLVDCLATSRYPRSRKLQ